MPARNSPWLIAACYVLHRLLVPRHPPNALRRLIAKPPCAGTSPTHDDFAFFARPPTGISSSTTEAQPIHDEKERSAGDPAGIAELTPREILYVRPASLRRACAALEVRAEMVEVNGIEPMTSCLQSRRSPN